MCKGLKVDLGGWAWSASWTRYMGSAREPAPMLLGKGLGVPPGETLAYAQHLPQASWLRPHSENHRSCHPAGGFSHPGPGLPVPAPTLGPLSLTEPSGGPCRIGQRSEKETHSENRCG